MERGERWDNLLRYSHQLQCLEGVGQQEGCPILSSWWVNICSRSSNRKANMHSNPRCLHPDLFRQPRTRIYPESAQAPWEGSRYCRSHCFQWSLRDECLGQGKQGSRGRYREYNPTFIFLVTYIEFWSIAFPHRPWCQILQEHWLGWCGVWTYWPICDCHWPR